MAGPGELASKVGPPAMSVVVGDVASLVGDAAVLLEGVNAVLSPEDGAGEVVVVGAAADFAGAGDVFVGAGADLDDGVPDVDFVGAAAWLLDLVGAAVVVVVPVFGGGALAGGDAAAEAVVVVVVAVFGGGALVGGGAVVVVVVPILDDGALVGGDAVVVVVVVAELGGGVAGELVGEEDWRFSMPGGTMMSLT